MIEILAGIGASFLTGVLGHIVFYPTIENWSNEKMRRLARPSIGVLLNGLPFLCWITIVLRPKENSLNKREVVLIAFAAYCMSFMWNGAGVAIGYMLDDRKI